jgi:hypothetical protein
MLKLKKIIIKKMMWKCLNQLKSHMKMRIMNNPAREDTQCSMDKINKKKPPPQPKGKERDPWVQRPVPYPQEAMKTSDDARLGNFIEFIKSLLFAN